MDESNVWSMDRLAAANLLADLRLEPNDANLERVERHFAQHRLAAMEWAAKRAQSSIIARVEAASARYFSGVSLSSTSENTFVGSCGFSAARG